MSYADWVNAAISMTEIDITFNVTQVSANDIALFRIPWDIFLNGS